MMETYSVIHPDTGEEVTVHNHAAVEQRHYVNSVNGHETFPAYVYAGNSEQSAEYVTQRLAEYLYDEFSIVVENEGIEAIRIDDASVEVL